MEEKTNGIVCSVETCAYHTKDNACHAGTIKVGGCKACDCEETCCDTFKATNYNNLKNTRF